MRCTRKGLGALAAAVLALAATACQHPWSERGSGSDDTRRLGARDNAYQRRGWLRCAEQSSRSLAGTSPALRDALVRRANACLRRYLSSVSDTAVISADATDIQLDGQHFHLDLRGLSPHLAPAFRFRVARDIYVSGAPAHRPDQAKFGVPLALLAERCQDAPICGLLPPEGVFRTATAWIEPGADPDLLPTLVIADPDSPSPLAPVAALASDHAAFYAWGTKRSPLRRLGIYALLGGNGAGKRAGVYLLEDYDPHKQPIIMVHGLGSSPLGWARLSSAIWSDEELRARYQVWHMVYATDAPLLVQRRRLQQHLDHAWRVLDPEGDDSARRGIVLVGHSLGGVLSRLLCSDSEDRLWNAAFDIGPDALDASSDDIETLSALFRFDPYAGVSRAIFLAAPHRGSPLADGVVGRFFSRLAGWRAVELQALRRVARDNPDAVHQGLRSTYAAGTLNSIATLRSSQPIRLATELLSPASSVTFHTIAASKPGVVPEGDGIVPLSSALLSGAASTLVVQGGHEVHLNDAAIAEVVRVLRLDASDAPAHRPSGGH